MTALGAVSTNKEIAPNAGVKMVMCLFPDTVIGGTDNATVDLTAFGCRNLRGILVNDQTTTGSVVATQAPTTSVTAGVLTITFGGSDTGAKTAILWID